MDNAKHNHHYVPRRYLRAWCRDGSGRIAVRYNGGAVALSNLEHVGCQDGGYSYEPLNPGILHSILCCPPRSRIVTDRMMREFFRVTVVIPVFYRSLQDPSNNEVIEMMRMITEANLLDEEVKKELEGLRRAFYLNRAETDKAMRDHVTTGYEDVFCNIENAAWPILDSLIKGKTGWVHNDKLAFRMFFYIFSQRVRTPGFIKKAMAGYSEMEFDKDMIAGGLYRRHILAVDSAAIMLSIRPRMTFRVLKATNGAEFITGDLPVVELNPEHSKDYYFPLSPERAFLFGPRMNFDRRNAVILKADPESAALLNQAIARDSANQIYGASLDSLQDI